MTQYILDQSNRKVFQSNQAKGKQPKTRIYQRVSYKDIICRKVVLDLFSITKKKVQKQSQDHDQNQKQERSHQEQALQSSVLSQFVVKIIGSRNNQYQAVLYQENFDCVLSELQLNKLSFPQRMKIFNCIALGLKDISARFICHRSLQPSHIAIFISNNKYVAKINHFYSAVRFRSQKGQITESPQISQYSSPQIKSNRAHGLQSDIWSLGAILNYLLYETLQNIWEQDGQIKIEVPKGTPDWLLQLLKSMLLFEPFKRYRINTIVEIVRTSLKCMDVLSKIVPIGRKYFKKQREQSKLEFF